MAGNSIIGALRLVLGVDSASFEDGLKKARGSLADFAAGLTRATAGIAVAMAGVGAAVAVAVKDAMSEANELGNLSRKFNAPVEELSKLKFLAEGVGASFETMAGKFQEALTNAESDGGRALKAIGVSATDATGKVRPMSDVMADVAAKFATFRDDADKTALAVKIFGDGAERLIPLLNQGARGIAGMVADAERFGVVVSKDTVEAAGKWSTAMQTLSAAAGGLGVQLAARLGPIAAQVAEWFVGLVRSATDTTNQFGLLKGSIEVLTVAFKSLVTVGVAVGAAFRNVWTVLSSSLEVMGKLARLDFTGAREIVRRTGAEIVAAAKDTVSTLEQVWSEGQQGLGKWATTVQTQKAPVVKSMQEIREAARAALGEIVNSPWENVAAKMIAVQQAFEAGTIKLDEFNKMTLRVEQEGLRQFREGVRTAMDEIVNAPTETFAAKMQAVNDAFAQGAIRAREYNRAVAQIARENLGHMTDLATATASTLQAVFSKNKAASIAAAAINTAVAITRAMQLPFPFNWAQAALAAATGAAQINAIKSTNFGSGSVASAPSGGGASAGSAGAAMAPAQQLITVEGFSDDRWYSGEQMRRFAESLMQYQRDGGKIVFAP